MILDTHPAMSWYFTSFDQEAVPLDLKKGRGRVYCITEAFKSNISTCNRFFVQKA